MEQTKIIIRKKNIRTFHRACNRDIYEYIISQQLIQYLYLSLINIIIINLEANASEFQKKS